MKTILFDAGPIISLATNNLLWVLEELKKKFNGSFALTVGVKRELVDKPLMTRRFKFEALQVQRLIDNNVISVIDDQQVISQGQRLLEQANKIFTAHGHPIQIVQRGEMETLAAATLYKAEAIIMDERITRTLLEDSPQLKTLMEKRLHMQLETNQEALHSFSEAVRHITILRSTELVTVAYELGILNKYIVSLPNARRELLESVLWGLKLNGCAITEDEINQVVRMEKA
ncbi:hypothetical protein HY489_00485 [Candidatus Woesearchaeota archaeon]|nr:hypothetical protein [Candidatus Woesearchaeota archaeon]